MTDATRLSEAMEKRRLQLRIKWTQVAERADLSLAGLGAIRRGERSPSPLTRARLEHALQWAPGSVDAILDGGDPIEDTASSDVSDLVRELIAERARLTASLEELESYGITKAAGYKILAEQRDRIDEQLRQVDRRGHKLGETGT